ncbi:MAG: 50S ribosomal protein L29 [archaeon]|nr:50S ribosomal protein L29 [archaeon]
MGKESIKELRKMGKIERDKKLSDLQEELLLLRSKNSMGGSLDNPSRIKNIRRTVARLKTLENDEKRGIIISNTLKQE